MNKDAPANFGYYQQLDLDRNIDLNHLRAEAIKIERTVRAELNKPEKDLAEFYTINIGTQFVSIHWNTPDITIAEADTVRPLRV